MIRISVFSLTLTALINSAIWAETPQEKSPESQEKLDLHDTIVQAREEEDRLQKLFVKIEGDQLFCNVHWMKTLTNEEFDNIISKFQSNFSQPKLSEINGLRFLADRLLSETPHLPSFKTAITLECQESRLKSTISNGKEDYQSTHIIDGHYHLFVNEGRQRVEIFRNRYPYLSHSLADFRISTALSWFNYHDKLQHQSVVKMLDEDRYEITIVNRTPQSSSTLSQWHRFNAKTRLIEEWKSYHNGKLIRHFLAIGETAIPVQTQNAQENELIWFPRYCLELKYSRGNPSGIRAQRIRSVELFADKDLDVTLPAKEGTAVVIKDGGRTISERKLTKDIEDVLEVYSRRLP